MKTELVQAFTEQARRLFSLCETCIDGSYSPDEKAPLLDAIKKGADALDVVDMQELFNEIAANLEEPMSEQQRERYCFSLLTPFGAYSDTLYPKVLISKSQENIDKLQGLDGADKLISIFENQIIDANERANKYFGLAYDADALKTDDEAKLIFFDLAQIIKGYGNMLDAAFVMYGLDLKRLQERCGVWLKQYRGGEAESNIRASQIKEFVGSLTLAEEYIKRLDKQEPQQKDLHNYCRKAIEKGYLVKTKDGYEKTKEWTKAQLAYFLKHFLNSDGTFPDKEYCLMFNEHRLSKAADQLTLNKNGDGKPKGYEIVDKLFEE